ncbi:MAG: hypothetical protein ACM3JD_10820 [Rudaea sp.]
MRRALNDPDAVVVDWESEALHGASFTSEICRFSGHAQSHQEILPWSLILKAIRSPDGKDEPTSLNYWKREALAYQSGLLDSLPAEICAPRCFGVDEQPGLQVWLWLEALTDEWPAGWSLDHYGKVAHHLGQFNGACFERSPLSTRLWPAKGRLRAWVAGAEPVIPVSSGVLAHPLVARLYPDDIYKRMLQVWSEHEAWIDLIENQPQTLAHLDAFRRNLFTRRDRRGDLQTVLIDWSLVGSAALGEEIAPLVAASLNFLEVSPGQSQALDTIVFDSYCAGLEQAGWQGDRRLVRFVYAASAVLRYSIGVIGITSMIADEQQHAILEQAFGHPLEELVDVWSQTNHFLYDLADEARRLYPLIR